MDQEKQTQYIQVNNYEASNRSSFEELGDALGSLNKSAGRSLSPFSITGGFTVSASWVLFGLIFATDGATSSLMLAIWIVSLFVSFR